MKDRELGVCLWVISDDAEIYRQVQEVLCDHAGCTRMISRVEAQESRLWREASPMPGAVLLDVGEELDWAVEVLRGIKRAHIRSPLIVLSREPTKEFGMKIVSAGINYFLPRDFEPQELRSVVTGLIKT